MNVAVPLLASEPQPVPTTVAMMLPAVKARIVPGQCAGAGAVLHVALVGGGDGVAAGRERPAAMVNVAVVMPLVVLSVQAACCVCSTPSM